jgi:hypothetical protein
VTAIVAAPAVEGQGRGRKAPKQTVDRGLDDAAPAAAAAATPVERNAGSARVIRQANGAAVAYLDASFEDALVATRQPDGTIKYTCVHGLEAGAEHVKTAPVVPAQPRLEEK